MMMKKEGTRRIVINLALFMLALVLLASTGPSQGAEASRASAVASSDAGDCMSQCHMNMSDCLGNGGGYQCIDDFYACSRGCDQLMQ